MQYTFIYIKILGQLRILLTRLDNRLCMGRLELIKESRVTRFLFYGLSQSMNGDYISWGEDSKGTSWKNMLILAMLSSDA